MRLTRPLLPTLLVVSTVALGVACGSDPPVAPATPFAVGPSGGEVWQPEEKAAPAPTPTPEPPPVASSAPPVASSASASASASTKKPPPKPPAPKPSASTK